MQGKAMDRTDECRREIWLADDEIRRIMCGHKDPAQDLFDSYLKKSEADRESMVMAMIGRLLLARARRAA
jgi:hypothetical protein